MGLCYLVWKRAGVLTIAVTAAHMRAARASRRPLPAELPAGSPAAHYGAASFFDEILQLHVVRQSGHLLKQLSVLQGHKEGREWRGRGGSGGGYAADNNAS